MAVLRTVVYLAIEVFLASSIAFFGNNLVPGFDVRGPFLFISPALAVGVFLLGTRRMFTSFMRADGPADAPDKELILQVAHDFGFGSVSVGTKKFRDRVSLVVGSNDEWQYLPARWDAMDERAKRFAAVKLMAYQQRTYRQVLSDSARALLLAGCSMLLAGCSLWLIVGLHATYGAWAAWTTHSKVKPADFRWDHRALKITRDLRGAIASVQAEAVDADSRRLAELRRAALQRSAVRLGIA